MISLLINNQYKEILDNISKLHDRNIKIKHNGEIVDFHISQHFHKELIMNSVFKMYDPKTTQIKISNSKNHMQNPDFLLSSAKLLIELRLFEFCSIILVRSNN